MCKEPKVGDKVLAIEIIERRLNKTTVNFYLLEIIMKRKDRNWQGKVLRSITVEDPFKLGCIEKYFGERQFISEIKFSFPTFSYTVLNNEDAYFVDAIFYVSDKESVWKEILNETPSRMVKSLKPYLLSKLGRK